MRNLRLTESCTQYQVTRNRRGDLVLTNLGTIPCLYRDVSLLNRGVNWREEIQVQGIFWFDPTATIKMGDVVQYAGQFYRMEDVTNAKALLSNDAMHFIKCNASLYRAIS